MLAVLNDATELKTLEAKFVQSQKMQAIGQLAGGVAHDFNNLLTAISGHCDLLLLRHDQGDQDYADLVQIHQNANRAASLVGQLLAFSRKQNLQPEVLDLRDTLSDLTHLLNRLAGEKVRLTLIHDPDLKSIRADKRQLEQVMMNLVVNARDAMPEGGDIDISTNTMTLETEFVRQRATVPAGEYVIVQVADQGVGISSDKLSKIFEPFYTTKRLGEGTGLGLSTAYGIVKQTGGFIFAESDRGRGTTFSLYFPVHRADKTARAAPQPPKAAVLARAGEGVILLVEDEAPVRAFASRALKMRGYQVIEADCAEEALELLKDDDLDVDVFVTDVIMPGLDGPTWVREALKKRPDVKVIFVSGYAEDSLADQQARIPNSVFLPKPFSLNQLAATVQEQTALYHRAECLTHVGDSQAVRSLTQCGEPMRFAMAAPIDLRNDFDSVSLRRLAKRTRDATQSRRLLALAEVYDGGSRTDASRIGGVGLQIIRDWVLRFNARGPDGLVDGKSPGAPSKLNADHRRALAEVVEAGPVPAVDGVVRWRRKDLARWLLETFAISLDETTVGRELKALGFAKISARPRHYAQNELAVEALKKTSPPNWRRSGRGSRKASR